MSTASISYSSLRDASGEAKSVATKLGKYADSLYSDVYRKLSNYSGSSSSNLTEAKSKTNAKINELRDEQTRYNTYADNLIGLRDECQAVDRAVRSSVSSLTASFKENHNINNSVVQNAISYFFTGLGNETAFGRWLGGKKDEFNAGTNYLKEHIKERYNYEGGKQFLQGFAVGFLEIVIAGLAIAGAVVTFVALVAASAVTGGAILVFIAGVVGGAIALVNGFSNVVNECAARSISKNDPATARRRSEINSVQDYLRSSFKFYDSEYYNPSDENEIDAYKEYYSEEGRRNEAIAMGIDIVNLACAVVTVINSVGNLLKNGYKWATGDAAKVKDISLKKVFSKETFTQFKGKMVDIKEAFKARSWQAAKDMGGHILQQIKMDFGRNFKNEFWDFYEINGEFNKKGAISSIKNMLSIPKDLLDDGFTISNIFKVGFSNIFLPSATAFTVNSNDATLIDRGDGQMKLDFTDKVTLDSFTGLFEKIGKTWKSTKNLLSDDSVTGSDVLDKLSSSCNVNISIPEINFPNIELPLLRAA